MDDFLRYLAGAIVGVLGTGGLIAILLYLSPHVLEKWAALLFGLVYRVFGLAHKRYVQYDIQGRVNEFTNGLRKEAPFVAETRVTVELAGHGLTREAFLKEDQVLVRLRREDRKDQNFIHGAFLFISIALLHNVKRYLSQSQRESVDLYVATKLLEREKPHLLGIFMDEYLHPRANKSEKVEKQLDLYAQIDRTGLFFPVLLQELHFLGTKVFGKRQDDRIISEVTALTDFLGVIAARRIGSEGDLNFEREYCRVAVVIVGKAVNITESGDVWVRFIRSALVPKRVETIYLVGPGRNAPVMARISSALSDSYHTYYARTHQVRILDPDGNPVDADRHVLVMRMIGAATIQPSA